MKKIRSLSLRFSLNILLFVSIVIVVMLLVAAFSSHQLIALEAQRATEAELRSMIKEIEIPLREVEIATADAAELINAMIAQPGVADRICEQLVARHDGITKCFISSRPIDTAGWSSPVRLDDGRHVVTFCQPLRGGALCVEVPIQWIEDLVRNMRPYPGSFTSILCPDGTTIGVDSATLVAMQETLSGNAGVMNVINNMRRGSDSLERFRIASKVYFAVYAPMHNGWSASVSCPYKEVLARSSQMHMVLFIIGLVGLLVIFILCYYIMRRLTKPITELSQAARNMSGGNLNSPLPQVDTHDEVLQLRDSFAFMQHSLSDYIEELKTTTAANNRMEGELSVASDIQMGMLRTDFPTMLHAKLVPAKEVGGDLYDFILHDDYLYFAVGDVSGKGAPAALMMSITRAALRFVAGLNLDIAQVMGRVNKSIADANSGDMFVTLFIGRLNTATGDLRFCNAGHNPIIIASPDGSVSFLKAKPNLALGVYDSFDFQGERLQLLRGTRLILYTDGITEAERADKSQYGEERLLAWASAHATTGSEADTVQSLYDDVRRFADGNPQNDDITIMTLKF